MILPVDGIFTFFKGVNIVTCWDIHLNVMGEFVRLCNLKSLVGRIVALGRVTYAGKAVSG